MNKPFLFFAVCLLAISACDKDESTRSSGGFLSPEFPADSALYSVVENDLIDDDGQFVLDLNGAIDPAGDNLEFRVDAPLEIDSILGVVKFESGYTIDADLGVDPNIMEAVDRYIDFDLTVIKASGDTLEHTYTITVEDIVPDWEMPTGNYYELIYAGNGDNWLFPVTVNGVTYHFADDFAPYADGEMTGGATVRKTLRSQKTFVEIQADVDDNDLDPQHLDLVDAFLADHFYVEEFSSGGDTIMWNFYYGTHITAEVWGKSLTHIKEKLEDAGYPFSDWTSGIHAEALFIYGDNMVYLLENHPLGSDGLLKVFAEMAVDMAIATH